MSRLVSWKRRFRQDYFHLFQNLGDGRWNEVRHFQKKQIIYAIDLVQKIIIIVGNYFWRYRTCSTGFYFCLKRLISHLDLFTNRFSDNGN
jgi:hypothetical protein